MGNSYSLARQEEMETRYCFLAEAVEVAERRARAISQADVETGLYTVPDASEGFLRLHTGADQGGASRDTPDSQDDAPNPFRTPVSGTIEMAGQGADLAAADSQRAARFAAALGSRGNHAFAGDELARADTPFSNFLTLPGPHVLPPISPMGDASSGPSTPLQPIRHDVAASLPPGRIPLSGNALQNPRFVTLQHSDDVEYACPNRSGSETLPPVQTRARAPHKHTSDGRRIVDHSLKKMPSSVSAETSNSHGPNVMFHGKPCTNLAHAAGFRPKVLKPTVKSEDWVPNWDHFPLKVFRGIAVALVEIAPHWDDRQLLLAVNSTYDQLRGWRKWGSLKDVSGAHMVYSDHSAIFPMRLPTTFMPTHNQCLRYLLRDPSRMAGKKEFMQVLTEDHRHGIELVEGLAMWRIAMAVIVPVTGTLVVAIVYLAVSRDVSDAFTIGSYLISAVSACLVMLGVLSFVEM